MKEVVIYARFSSHSQTEQSIEGQLRECYEFAKEICDDLNKNEFKNNQRQKVYCGDNRKNASQ